MTCLPLRCRKVDKCVAVALLVICEREIKKNITKPPVQRRNVTDKILEALTSTDVLNKIMPVLTQKITETIVSVIVKYTIIKVITKLPNSEQSYKGKVKTHNYINRQNQSTTGKL